MVSDIFPIVIDRVRRLLEHYEVRYATVVAEWEDSYVKAPERVKQDMRRRFSGMGGLNDVCISRDNGHRVKDKIDEIEANFEFRSLLYVLWEEVEDPLEDIIPVENLHLVKKIANTSETIEATLSGNDLQAIFDVLVWNTYYFDDADFVRNWCLRLTHHLNFGVRKLAIACLADLYRLRKTLDAAGVINRLTELMSDLDLCNRAKKAIDTIRQEVMN
jgi:hypothetical protein